MHGACLKTKKSLIIYCCSVHVNNGRQSAAIEARRSQIQPLCTLSDRRQGCASAKLLQRVRLWALSAHCRTGGRAAHWQNFCKESAYEPLAALGLSGGERQK